MEKNAKLSPKDNGVIFSVVILSCYLSALLREIASKYYGDLYCLYCLTSYKTKNKLESHKKVCENKDVCNIVMPSEDNKILESNQY